MLDGFLRVSAAGPQVALGNPAQNAEIIINTNKSCVDKGVRLAVFPELCITGYSCGDLFLQRYLLEDTLQAIINIAQATRELDILFAVGAPIEVNNKLYNCAVVIKDGNILGIVPKVYIPNYTEYYELRHFTSGIFADRSSLTINNKEIPFGTKLLFQCNQMKEFCVAFEICEDLWLPASPGTDHALAGAMIIGNLSASNETIGKTAYRRDLVRMQSATNICSYIYSSSGEGESTTDLVFSRHKLIAENGRLLAENNIYEEFEKTIQADIDLHLINHERRRMNTYFACHSDEYRIIGFDSNIEKINLKREISKTPFIPYSKTELDERCIEIIELQSEGLKRRIIHTNPKKVVVNISGGLDSTLALLVVHRAMLKLDRDPRDIIGITIPGPGTSKRTKSNATGLIEALNCTLRTIGMTEDFKKHLEAIGHDGSPDVTYENAQARERTQIAMDTANMEGGIFVGTPDLSEIALGFATFGGDHISMYGVNCGVPKTLIRYLIGYLADRAENELKTILYDILDTPISPELLPLSSEGTTAQHTEKILGDYLLHDFILYYFLRYGFTKEKIIRLMEYAFEKDYSEDELKKALDVFYRRFYSNQFKRSCMPDGPKVGSISLSPRGDWRMPSDIRYGRNE